MKIRELLFILCFSARACHAAAPVDDALKARLVRLRDAALASDYALTQVGWLANGIGPRLSGSRGAAAAVDYVAGELARQGLTVRREPLMVPHWVRGQETGELVSWPGQAEGLTQTLHLTALGRSVATPRHGLTARVTVASSFEELERMPRERVEGTIVLWTGRFDRELAAIGRGGEAYGRAVAYRVKGASAAAKKGAVASLLRSAGGAEFRLPHTGVLSYDDGVPKIPAAAVSSEDADLIAYHVARGGATVHLVLTPRTLPDAPSANVVADLPGTEHPGEVVIVSGHLDSWDLGGGAIDDGVGVAMAMATAKLVRDLGLAPRRTIRVVAWMNEENGSAGAKGYVRAHAADLAQHVAAIESDLGADHPLGYHLHIADAATPFVDPVAGVLASCGAGLLDRRNEPVGSDLEGLGAAGIPTFSVEQDSRTYFDYHHTAADTFDKVHPRELAENVAAMAVMAYALASTPEALPRVPPGRTKE